MTVLMGLKRYDPEKTWFTSDTHFYHEWVIRSGLRDFPDVETMNETIIRNWNRVVGPDHTVFHLGDFAFTTDKYVTQIIRRLNGDIRLIYGNHEIEHFSVMFNKHFSSRRFQECIRLGRYKVFLNHFPLLCFPLKPHYIQLYGHVHSKPGRELTEDQKKLVHLLPTQYEVGMDLHDLTPVSGVQILEHFDRMDIG